MAFDLHAFLNEAFPSLTFDGGLFYRWPVGIRFELAGNAPSAALRLDQATYRASALYEAVFAVDDACVVLSQDWPADSPSPSPRHLMSLQAFAAAESIGLIPPTGQLDVPGSEDSYPSILRWAQQPARSFNYTSLFRGIANADHAIEPSVRGSVYLLNPHISVIFHMYDFRGLDVIASDKESIRALYEQCNSWILDYDRERIDRLFQR